MNQAVNMNYWSIWLMGAIVLLLLFITHPACASSAGGGLPFDSYLTKIQKSITGPFAFTAAIIGLVGAGATLILGEMNGFCEPFSLLYWCFHSWLQHKIP